MTNVLENDKKAARSKRRKLVIVSGYYGFDNLGDEAICEEITDELKQLIDADQIVVLSNTPEQTAKRFQVRSINRWHVGELAKMLPSARLLVSGGGGLFQDAVSFRSPIFYGTQIMLAKALGTPVMIYAQGLGPLTTFVGKVSTQFCLAMCDQIVVRDPASFQMLQDWSIPATLSADPVWRLEAKPVPDTIAERLSAIKSRHALVVGLSLRLSNHFTAADLTDLVEAMANSLPTTACIVPLSLQASLDDQILQEFCRLWAERGHPVEQLDSGSLLLPSQWATMLRQFDMVIAMRLHAAILALKSGVPTVAVAYDPKVSHVAHQFGQPTLNLTNHAPGNERQSTWSATIKSAVESRDALSRRAKQQAEEARNLACQNFSILAKILGMQSVSK